MHVVLLSFSKEYKTWLVESEHNLVALLPVESEKSEVMKNMDTGGFPEAGYGCSISTVLYAGELMLVTSGANGEERQMRIFQ